MQRISDIPVFDAADYLDTPQDCGEFLIELIDDGSDDDLCRGLAAVARATGRRVDDLPRSIVEMVSMRLRDGEHPSARRVMEKMGVTLSLDLLRPNP